MSDSTLKSFVEWIAGGVSGRTRADIQRVEEVQEAVREELAELRARQNYVERRLEASELLQFEIFERVAATQQLVTDLAFSEGGFRPRVGRRRTDDNPRH